MIEDRLGYAPLVSGIVMLLVILRWRSIWALPITMLILLPSINLPLMTISIGPVNAPFTYFDVGFLFCSAALIIGRKSFRKARLRLKHDAWYIAIFAIGLIIPIIVSNTIGNLLYQSRHHLILSTFITFRIYCQALVLPLFIFVFLRERDLKSVIIVLYLFSLFGIFQAVVLPAEYDSRAMPFGMNPNTFGSSVALIFIFSVTVFLGKISDNIIYTGSLVGIMASGLGIIISGSREALFGAVAGGLFLTIKMAHSRNYLGRLMRIVIVGLVFLVVYQSTIGIHKQYASVFGRMETMLDEKRFMADKNFETRILLSLDTLSYYIQNPSIILTGRGNPVWPFADFVTGEWDSDSAYLNTLSSFGVFGLGGIVLFLFYIWRAARKLRSGTSSAEIWSLGIQSAIVTYCTIGFASNVFGNPHTTIIFLVIVSVGMVNIGTLPGVSGYTLSETSVWRIRWRVRRTDIITTRGS